MSSQKFTKLIQELAKDLPNPSETRGWTTRFWASWVASFVLIGAATWYTTYRWPYRSFLPDDLSHPMFWIEGAFWILASVASAVCAYQSSFPVWPKNQAKIFALGLISALVAYSFVKGGGGSFSSELGLERGGCGIFILLFGAVSAAWMISVMKRAAPTRLAESGAWAAVSTGCLGASFMHLVCSHENIAHVLLWHITPILILVSAVAISARKTLSW